MYTGSLSMEGGVPLCYPGKGGGVTPILSEGEEVLPKRTSDRSRGYPSAVIRPYGLYNTKHVAHQLFNSRHLDLPPHTLTFTYSTNRRIDTSLEGIQIKQRMSH